MTREYSMLTAKTFADALKHRVLGEPSLLICLEPASSYPPNHSIFSRVFTNRIDPGVTSVANPIRWPIDFRPLVLSDEADSQSSREGIVMIASDKVGAHPRALYPIRRNLAEQREALNLDVFGEAWQKSRVNRVVDSLKALALALLSFSPISARNLMGFALSSPLNVSRVTSKFEVMKAYKYSIVIENEMTYVSEKLLESIFAGTLPIYVGPQIPHDWIPQDLFIRSGPTWDEILFAIASARAMDYQDYWHRSRSWLSSQSALEWEKSRVCKSVGGTSICFC